MSTFAAESGHWYEQDGTPRYTVPAKKGGTRPTTIRDARILGLVPSVTTIIRCAAAPGLERWKAEQLLLAALTMPRLPDEPEAMWRARVQKDSQEEGRKAAERGTQIHAAIEAHYRGLATSSGEEFGAWVDHVVGGIGAWFGPQAWGAERSFAHPLGYGGKVDLHSPAVLLDFKSKDTLDGVRLYDEHLMQLAAYAKGLGLEKPRAGIVFVHRRIPAATCLEVSDDELVRGWKMFRSLLDYWRAANDFGGAA